MIYISPYMYIKITHPHQAPVIMLHASLQTRAPPVTHIYG
jgi:hypothetical protein